MCDEREQLLDYLYDEGDSAARRRMSAHLETCAACRDELRDLAEVRQSLGAWDVPVRPSVWTPFVPPRAAAWWRQVPAWAVATAAALVIASGGIGGVVARSIAASPPVQVAAAPDADAIAARVLAQLRTSAPQATSAAVAPATSAAHLSDTELMARVRDLVDESERRQRHDTALTLTSLLSDLQASRAADREYFQRLVANTSEQTSGQLLQVLDATKGAQGAKGSKEK